MLQAFAGLFSDARFLPHGYCLAWSPPLLWTLAIANGFIGISYYSIPLALARFVRGQRDLKFHSIFLLFGGFIFACGTTHFINVLDIWYPIYPLDAAVLAVTAGISLATALLLWPMIPQVRVFLEQNRSDREQLVEVNRRLTEQNREITLLGELGETLLACGTLDEISGPVRSRAQELFPGCSGCFYQVIHSPGPCLKPLASWGQALRSEPVFSPEDCWALRKGEVRWTDAKDGLSCRHLDHDPGSPLALCVPMMVQDDTLGLLFIQCRPDKPADLGSVKVARADLRRLAAMTADRVGVAIANIQLRVSLKQQSIRDPLTGLYNRRYLEETLPREVSRAQREQSSLAVLMIDVDHFKSFNDSFGHDVGDKVLRVIGQTLARHCRSGDLACRLGGEEFAAVLPVATREQAMVKARLLLQDIRRIDQIYAAMVPRPVTVSIGIALCPADAASAEALLQAADQALYRAKHSGRNRAVCAGEALEQS